MDLYKMEMNNKALRKLLESGTIHRTLLYNIEAVEHRIALPELKSIVAHMIKGDNKKALLSHGGISFSVYNNSIMCRVKHDIFELELDPNTISYFASWARLPDDMTLIDVIKDFTRLLIESYFEQAIHKDYYADLERVNEAKQAREEYVTDILKEKEDDQEKDGDATVK